MIAEVIVKNYKEDLIPLRLIKISPEEYDSDSKTLTELGKKNFKTLWKLNKWYQIIPLTDKQIRKRRHAIGKEIGWLRKQLRVIGN